MGKLQKSSSLEDPIQIRRMLMLKVNPRDVVAALVSADASQRTRSRFGGALATDHGGCDTIPANVRGHDCRLSCALLHAIVDSAAELRVIFDDVALSATLWFIRPRRWGRAIVDCVYLVDGVDTQERC